MTRWAKTWGMIWLTAAVSLAAPLLDEPVATLTLKDGTVLRDARAKGFLAKVVMVKHRDGARTVAYELFPDEYQAVLAARRSAAQASAQIDQAQSDAEVRKQAQARATASLAARSVAPEPGLNQVCRLTLTGSKGNVAILRIDNVSDQTAALVPWQLVARTHSGELFLGTHWVGLDEEGRAAVTLKRQQFIGARATMTLGLMLKAPPDIEDGCIEAVLWRMQTVRR